MKTQVALVTGAASGIGKATALTFAHEGAAVVVSDVQEAQGIQTADQIQRAGGRALFVGCDVKEPSQVRDLVARTLTKFGRLDYAFNNAGTEGSPGPLHELSSEHWEQTIATNLTGVYHCMREELDWMIKQGSGAIVNCSSIAGLRGFAESAAYCASKHAVLGLTKASALEYAPKNIRINAICPGVIRTPMIERFTHGDAKAEAALTSGSALKRMGSPEEIAKAVVWLCSPAASFIIGTELIVDGGWCAK